MLHALEVGEFGHQREAPPPALADWVEHGSARVFGIHTGRWTRVLEGRSSAFGIKFRPGAFRPFLRDAVSSLRMHRCRARHCSAFDRCPAEPDWGRILPQNFGHLPIHRGKRSQRRMLCGLLSPSATGSTYRPKLNI